MSDRPLVSEERAERARRFLRRRLRQPTGAFGGEKWVWREGDLAAAIQSGKGTRDNMTEEKAADHPVKLGGIHHAAYRCKDAKETVEWYGRVLGMGYTTAFAEDHVPSTGEYDPYMHVFLDAGNGNVLAFFELPNQKDMGRDENTPAWVQHLAFKVPDEDALLAAKAHVEAQGIDVLGPTHHGIFKSIYFFDPNGHRVELATDIGTDEQYAELARVAPLMLEEWSQTKTAPRHADWLHEIARKEHAAKG